MDEAKSSASQTVAWNAAARTVGEVVAKLASVVFFLVVARELGADRFGDLIFALSFMTVITLPSGFGTEELIARDVARDPELVHEYASNVMAIKVALSVALVLLGEAIVLLLDYSSEVALVVLIVGAAVAIENLGRTWGAVLQAYQRQEVVAVALIVQRVLTAAAGVGVIALGGGLVAVSVVMLVSALVGFAVATVAMQRLVVAVRPRIDVARWRPLMMAGVPIGTVAVLLVALVKIDQSLLSFLSEEGNRDVGFYGAAFRLTEATWFIGWAISAAMLPWFAAHGRRPGRGRIGVRAGDEGHGRRAGADRPDLHAVRRAADRAVLRLGLRAGRGAAALPRGDGGVRGHQRPRRRAGDRARATAGVRPHGGARCSW